MRGNRKTLVMLITIVIAVVLRYSHQLTGDQLVDLLKFTIPAFFAGNALENFTQKNQ